MLDLLKHVNASVEKDPAIVNLAKLNKEVICVDNCFLDKVKVLSIVVAQHVKLEGRSTLTLEVGDRAQGEERGCEKFLVLQDP